MIFFNEKLFTIPVEISNALVEAQSLINSIKVWCMARGFNPNFTLLLSSIEAAFNSHQSIP